MSFERELDKIKKEIREYLPEDIQIQKIEFEGPEIAVYSKGNSNGADVELIQQSDILKELAKKMRKRISRLYWILNDYTPSPNAFRSIWKDIV